MLWSKGSFKRRSAAAEVVKEVRGLLKAGSSSEYLRNLASLNFEELRKKWALALALRAKALGTYPERTLALLDKLTHSEPPGFGTT